MGFVFRKRVRTGPRSWLNVSRSGVSESVREGRVTANSRSRVSIRLAPGLSFRFGGKRRR